jgi:hypothetical protein
MHRDRRNLPMVHAVLLDVQSGTIVLAGPG